MKQTELMIDILSKPEDLIRVGQFIRDGKTVVFPTETVYGLGANGLSALAIDKIYVAKGRPSDNPLILHIDQIDQLGPLVIEITGDAQKLIEAFWPGPLTLVFKKSDCVPYKATGGLETVAIRMPRHPVARAIIAAAGVPVAAPSANLSGKPSPTLAKHVIEDMAGRVDMIVCDDSIDIGLESTVCDVSGGEPTILRPGSVSLEDIRRVLGRGSMDQGEIQMGDRESPRSPGMKYTHYAPEAPMILLQGSKEEIVTYIIENELVHERIGFLLFQDTLEALGKPGESLGERGDMDAIALRLFENLRHFRGTEYDKIVCEMPAKSSGVSEAIRNRLLKAAGNQLIQIEKSL